MSTGQQPEVVAITGAAAGVGRATAIAFAKHGAHGEFDSKSRERSPELWVVTHQRQLAAAGLGLAIAACLAMVRKGR
jgi:NAD(P)-dependent dehydrogenase (short-subunit alcohol dehydrogenase family)